MKKNVKEIMHEITISTPIEEACACCDTVTDLEVILSKLPQDNRKHKELSNELKQSALELLKNGERHNIEDITVSYIQKSLGIGCSLSLDVYEWLKQIGE